MVSEPCRLAFFLGMIVRDQVYSRGPTLRKLEFRSQCSIHSSPSHLRSRGKRRKPRTCAHASNGSIQQVERAQDKSFLDKIKWSEAGLVTVIVQVGRASKMEPISLKSHYKPVSRAEMLDSIEHCRPNQLFLPRIDTAKHSLIGKQLFVTTRQAHACLVQ